MTGINRKEKERGQVILEFTFAFIIVLVMIYGAMRIFRWTGIDLVERFKAHDAVLHKACCDYGFTDRRLDVVDMPWGPQPGMVKNFVFYPTVTVLDQLDPHFYGSTPMKATWDGK